MLLLVLLTLLACAAATTTWLSLSDLQYTAPVCSIPGRGAQGAALSLLNSFGQLGLSNDLMGAQLRLTLALDPLQRSCRFCTQQQSYCTQTYGTANSTTGLHLADDTSYNVRVISLADDNTASQSLLLPVGQLAVSVATPGQRCGAQLSLVVQAILTAEAPTHRDFLVQARDPDAPLLVNCSQTLSDLSCRLAPAFYRVAYRVDNCVASQQGSSPLPPVPARPHSYVQQYYEAVAMRDDETRDALRALTLCGESWLALFERARLEIYCDAQQAVFVALKPWYRAALVTAAAWRSGRRDLAVWQALEQLERLCVVRDEPLEYLSNWTIALARDLAPLPTEDGDWATLCEWAQQAAPRGPLVELHTNVTLPWYWTHETDWYFAPFLYVIYYNDPWMGVKAAALVALFVLSGAVVITGLCYVVFVIWRHQRQRYVVIN
jgi:hypothetical protein